MPANITASAGIAIDRHRPAIVELKENWWDDWTWYPELSFAGGRVCSAGDGTSGIAISRRYGRVKHPWEVVNPYQRAAWRINGWWVRVSFLDVHGGRNTVFVGRVDGESRNLHGVDNGPSGHQSWACYGPEQILAKTCLGRSFWLVPDAKADAETPGVVKQLGTLPDFNREDEGQFGNRTTYRDGETEDEPGTSYLFGGTQQWSNYDIVEYVLAKFLDESSLDDPGPKWRLAGQADVLKDFYATLSPGATITAAELLKVLVPMDRGLDYVIRPYEEEDGDEWVLAGYEVCVFSISAREWSFGSQTMPANPNRVHFDLGSSNGVEVHLARSAEHRFGRLRLIGERIVLCGSLWGPEAKTVALSYETASTITQGDNTPWTPEAVWAENVLTKRWTDGLELDYKKANGLIDDFAGSNAITADDIRELDEVRSHAKYDPVYQHFGGPDEWDMATGGWAPSFDGNGELLLEESTQVAGEYQIQVRATLDWLPLMAGYDYAPVAGETGELTDSDWPVQTNEAVDRAELLNPMVWVYDASRGGFVDVSKEHEIGVRAPRHEWGVELNVTPNHFLAENHWEEQYLTLAYPDLDWEDLVCTIAMEMDHRYTVDIELPGARPADGVKDVRVADCHLWVLAPCTMLRGKRWDDDTSGPADTILVHSGPFTRVLRRDSEKMELAAAGCVSRYLAERLRVRMEAKAALAWGPLVGQLLGWLNEGGDATDVEAPITRVEWQSAGGSITTTVFAGFAE